MNVTNYIMGLPMQIMTKM